MNREFLSYFNLSDLPFTKEISAHRLLKLPSVEKALASVRLLVQTRGIGMLIGESGSGKSCVIRLLDSEMNPGLHKLLYFCHSSIGILEFYIHLCSAFGLEVKRTRAAMFRDIKDRILSLNDSSHIHPILVLDDAHLLCTEILQEIRLLTNFEIDSRNALTVLLCGQQTLTKKFGLTQLEPLANSIVIQTHLTTLPKEETFSYIEQRIAQVGGNTGMFTQNALTLIHQASAGIMRTINTIAQAAMMKAYLGKSQQVEAECVQSVIER